MAKCQEIVISTEPRPLSRYLYLDSLLWDAIKYPYAS